MFSKSSHLPELSSSKYFSESDNFEWDKKLKLDLSPHGVSKMEDTICTHNLQQWESEVPCPADIDAVERYPSVKDLARMSNISYKYHRDKEAFTTRIRDPKYANVLKNYKIIYSAANEDMHNGFHSVLFYREGSLGESLHQIVIAIAGTETTLDGIFPDIEADLYGVVYNRLTPQVNSAVTFGLKMLNFLTPKISCRTQVIVTGHSLGGWLAQVVSFAIKYLRYDSNLGFLVNNYNGQSCTEFELDTHINPYCVVFDAPGAYQILCRIANLPFIRDRVKFSSTTFGLDISIISIQPNLINTMNNHVGKIYLLKTSEIIERPVAFISKANFAQLQFTHGLENIIHLLDQDFNSNPTKYGVTFWPLTIYEGITTKSVKASSSIGIPILHKGDLLLDGLSTIKKIITSGSAKEMEDWMKDNSNFYYHTNQDCQVYEGFSKMELQVLEMFIILKEFRTILKIENSCEIIRIFGPLLNNLPKLGINSCNFSSTQHIIAFKNSTRFQGWISREIKGLSNFSVAQTRFYSKETFTNITTQTFIKLSFQRCEDDAVIWNALKCEECSFKYIYSKNPALILLRICQLLQDPGYFSSKEILYLTQAQIGSLLNSQWQYPSDETTIVIALFEREDLTMESCLLSIFNCSKVIIKPPNLNSVSLKICINIDASLFDHEVNLQRSGRIVQIKQLLDKKTHVRELLEHLDNTQGTMALTDFLRLGQQSLFTLGSDRVSPINLPFLYVLNVNKEFGGLEEAIDYFRETQYPTLNIVYNPNCTSAVTSISHHKNIPQSDNFVKYLHVSSNPEQEFDKNWRDQEQKRIVNLIQVAPSKIIWKQHFNPEIFKDRQFVGNKEVMNESEFFAELLKSRKNCILAGDPGAGKTFSMIKMAKNWVHRVSSKDWILFKSFKNFKTVIINSKELISTVSQGIEIIVHNFEEGFSSNILRSLLVSKSELGVKVVLFLDAFDELDKYWKDFFIAFLTLMKACPNLVIICSSRLHEVQRLETSLSVEATSFKLLNDIKIYLAPFWRGLFPQGNPLFVESFTTNVETFAEYLLDSNLKFIGLPLTQKMLGDILLPDLVRMWTEKQSDFSQVEQFLKSLSLTKLYTKFYEIKCNIFKDEKLDINPQQESYFAQIEKRLELILQQVAAAVLNFDADNVHLILEQGFTTTPLNFEDNSDSNDFNHLLQSGLVIKESSAYPEFFHLSFAEYFMAKFIFKVLSLFCLKSGVFYKKRLESLPLKEAIVKICCYQLLKSVLKRPTEAVDTTATATRSLVGIFLNEFVLNEKNLRNILVFTSVTPIIADEILVSSLVEESGLELQLWAYFAYIVKNHRWIHALLLYCFGFNQYFLEKLCPINSICLLTKNHDMFGGPLLIQKYLMTRFNLEVKAIRMFRGNVAHTRINWLTKLFIKNQEEKREKETLGNYSMEEFEILLAKNEEEAIESNVVLAFVMIYLKKFTSQKVEKYLEEMIFKLGEDFDHHKFLLNLPLLNLRNETALENAPAQAELLLNFMTEKAVVCFPVESVRTNVLEMMGKLMENRLRLLKLGTL